MISQIRQHSLVGVSISFVIAFVVGALAAEDPSGKSAERESALKRAELQIRQCEMRRAEEPQVPVERIERALLTFEDPSRKNTNGTLWAFGASGRPLAFLELFHGEGSEDGWVHAMTLTGTTRVTMKMPQGARWQPKQIQIEPKLIADAAAPAEKEESRLRQMKELARHFEAHEFWDPDNSRFELRPLVRPVHRYQDVSSGICDGAAFVFANGTNPEVILMIEALGKELKTSRWHYSLARLGSAEIHVELNQKEVWKRDRTPGVVGTPEDPYWLLFSPKTSSN